MSGGVYRMQASAELEPAGRRLVEPRGERPPDRPGPAVPRKAELIVRPPRHIVAIQPDVLDDARQIDERDAIADPAPRQLVERMRPDLPVVGTKEHLADAGAKRGVDPFAEMLRPRSRLRRGPRGRDQPADAARLLGFGQPVEVQLKRIRHEPRAQPDPRLALVIEPAVGAEEIVHQLVEVVVVAELHVAAEVPGEARLVDHRACQAAGIGRGFAQHPVGLAARKKTPRGAEPGWARADDQQAGGLRHACVRTYSPASARSYKAVCPRHKCSSVRCSS